MPIDPHLQAVRNLALLARQAISNGDATLSVNPQMIADAALKVEAVLGAADLTADNVSASARIKGLEAELNAARANVDSLTRQIEQRYQDGIREGASVAEREVRELRAKLTLLEVQTGQTVALTPKSH